MSAIVKLGPGSTAIRASRRETPKGLEFFPTPPWATRALCEHVLSPRYSDLWPMTVRDPCAGEGHMTGPLAEYFGRVYASDVHDYGAGFEVGSYIGEGIDVLPPERVDFVIMNPPFSKAEAFLKRALAECVVGVSMFIRIQWLESQGRVTDIFEPLPPTNVSIFAERCGLWAGRWVPRASTATCYTWITWIKEELERGPFRQPTELEWIPVGSLDRFTRPEDAPRYGWNGEQ